MVIISLKNRTKILAMIAKNGKNLNSFADEIGISSGYLSQILNGKKNPSPKIAHKIAKGIGVNLEEVFLIKVN